VRIPTVQQWALTLQRDGQPRAAGLFWLVNGWTPTLIELAAWMRWMSLRCGALGYSVSVARERLEAS